MQTIYDQLYPWYKFKKNFGRFGLEIETEVKHKNAYPGGFLIPDVMEDGKDGWQVPSLPGWVAHRDDSLRNFGVEYVFREPVDFKKANELLDLFENVTRGVKFIEGSPGTSVHVHVNVLPETFLTMANFCTLFTMFENLLVEFSGELRRSNLFALPNRVAETTYWNVCEMFKEIEKGNSSAIMFSDQNVKYAVLNLARLNSFGSLEIRCFRGTAIVDDIKQWLGILNRLVEFSRTPGLTPKVIIAEYNLNSIEFFSNVFEDYAGVLRSIPGFEGLVNRNLWYAGSIAMAAKDWMNIDNHFMEKTPPKSKGPKTQPFTLPLGAYDNATLQVAAQQIYDAPVWGVTAQHSIDDYEES